MARSVDCSVSLSPGVQTDPGDVKANVTSHTDSVLSRIEELKGTAEGLQQHAESLLSGVGELESVDVAPIEFRAALSDYQRKELALPPELQGLYQSPTVDTGDFDSLPELNVQAFEPSAVQDAPDIPEFSFPEAPEFDRVGAVPSRPDVEMPEVPDAPEVDIDLRPLPELQGLPEFDVEFPELRTVQIDTPDWADIPLPDESVLARYENLAANRPELADYVPRVVNEGLQAAEALLRGEFVIDMDALDAGTAAVVQDAVRKHEHRMQSLWSRRGLPATARASDRRDAGVVAHVDQVRDRMSREARIQFDASVERWRMRLLPVALQLNVEAHSFLIEKKVQLLDLDFEMLTVEKEAQTGLYALLAAKYRIASAKIEKQLAEYRAIVEQIRARVAAYSAYVNQQQNVARLNQARGTAYAAEQDAQIAEASEFEAYVRAAQAVARAYNAMVRGVEGRAEALGARLAQFEARSSEWQAELTEVRTEYNTRRVENQAIVAQNRASAAEVSAEAAGAEAVASASMQSAAQVSSEAAQLRAAIANRTAQNAETGLRNSEEALRYKSDVLDYRADATMRNARLLQDMVDYAAIEANNSAVSGLSSEMMSSLGRVAELTQQYQTQIAQSYIDLAGTVADAEAARVSGKVSPYRASAGLTARGDVGHASRVQRRENYSNDYQQSDSNQCRTIFREVSI